MTTIRVKSMLLLPHPDGERHLVSRLESTPENPHGYHRLIGGSIEPGESAEEAAHRELDEELGATVTQLTRLDVVENIYRIRGQIGHEIVFVFAGLLADSSVVPDGGRWFDDGGPVWTEWIRYDDRDLPLHPAVGDALDRARLGTHP